MAYTTLIKRNIPRDLVNIVMRYNEDEKDLWDQQKMNELYHMKHAAMQSISQNSGSVFNIEIIHDDRTVEKNNAFFIIGNGARRKTIPIDCRIYDEI